MIKTALIIGNGPSVDKLDPAHLSAFHTFGTNSIAVKFPEWGRATDTMVITDHARLRQYGERYRDYKGDMFIGDEKYIYPTKTLLKEIDGILQRPYTYVPQLCKARYRDDWRAKLKIKSYINSFMLNRRVMCFDLSRGINYGGSVVVAAIQIAVSQGFRRILLTGVDATYGKGKTDYFSGSDSKPLWPKDMDEYFDARMIMEPMFVLLQVYFDQMGVELLDCTPGGALKFIGKSSIEAEVARLGAAREGT